MFWYVFASVAAVIIIKTLFNRRQTVNSLPPRVPGNTASTLDVGQLHVEIRDWARKFGYIFTFDYQRSPVIAVCNYELVEDILHLVNNRTKQRPDTDQIEPDQGLIIGHFTDPNWVHTRKVTYQTLKSYGAVTLELEGLIQSEVEDLIDAISKIGGHPVQPSHMINITVCSVISSLMLGEKLGREHSDIQTMLDLTQKSNELVTIGVPEEDPYSMWHSFLRSNPKRTCVHDMRNQLLQLYFKNKIHKEKRGLIYLLQQNTTEQPLSDNQVKAVFADFLTAGVNTTTTASMAFLLLLLHHREVLERLQQEVDGVIGRSRTPTLQDQSEMPLLQAALLETLRFLSPVPVIMRCAHTDLEFEGYNIPIDTQFMLNVWMVNHDPGFWEGPQIWRPSRFLDEVEQVLPPTHPARKRVELVFGGGKRVCPAKTFVKARLFLMFAAILQRFDLRPDPNDPPPVLDPEKVKQSKTIIVPKYHVRFITRE